MSVEQVQDFLRANSRSPVVSGWAIEENPNKPSRGAVYELMGGHIFKLTAEECREIGLPWWKGQPKPEKSHAE